MGPSDEARGPADEALASRAQSTHGTRLLVARIVVEWRLYGWSSHNAVHDLSRRHFFLATSASVLSWSCLRSHHALDPSPTSPAPVPAAGYSEGPEHRVADSTAEFLAAVGRGDVAAVQQALAATAALASARDEQGRTAIVIACRHGHDAVAKLLVAHGGHVGLVEAVMIPDWPTAERLATADPSALNAWHPVGGTPLYAAAVAGNGELWRLQALGADANANPRGNEGVTPAFGAIECTNPIDAWCTLVDLLSNSGDVSAAQRDGDTLLHAASRRGDINLIGYLIRRGADPTARDADGSTPLDLARAHGHTAAIALLRRAHEVPRNDQRLREAFDASGGTVSWPDLSDIAPEVQGRFTGSSHGRLDIVREMLAADRRLAFSRSNQDELSIEACAHTGNRDVMTVLLDYGLPMSLCTAISMGELSRARALLGSHPTSIHERGPHDFALMWYPSIGGGGVEAAELLLEFGTPIDQSSRGTTALHQAAMRGQLELVAFLVERGAELSAVSFGLDRAGITPLGLARAREQTAVADFLEQHGAM